MLLKGLRYVPRVIITDKLKSYGAEEAEVMPGVEHRQHKRLNNRAENSPQPTRLKDKVMRRFKPGACPMVPLRLRRYFFALPASTILTAERYQEEMRLRFTTCVEVSYVQAAA